MEEEMVFQREIKIEAFVLAGGKSTRMGQDKGLMLLKGKPMVSYILDTLQKINIPTNIIANNSSYHIFGLPVYSDIVSEKGPMGGLLTAFENTTADMVLLIGCDTPLISVELIKHLLSLANKEKIIVPGTAGKINPLFALYPLHLKQSLEERMSTGQLKMADFILKNQHILVDYTAQQISHYFTNINNRHELLELERKWKIPE
ncbi:MAG TPA: molybdenum cofactor guanylyltransferase [Pseudosphingobacterium sp.]|nr:molybdenum cofactor guanylyltransferase [Pseudosphingobacterium sp.]